MRTYYRTQKGFEDARYRVPVSEPELRGLITTIVISAAALTTVLTLAAFLLGLSIK